STRSELNVVSATANFEEVLHGYMAVRFEELLACHLAYGAEDSRSFAKCRRCPMYSPISSEPTYRTPGEAEGKRDRDRDRESQDTTDQEAEGELQHTWRRGNDNINRGLYANTSLF
ncbi:unnamed protein product, partial [Ectocarpus sp. 8 AP-2014]